MKSTPFLSASVMLTMLFASCDKSSDSVYNPNPSGKTGQLHYEIKVANTAAGIGQKTTANGNVQWTSGFANPTLVKFEATQSGSEIEFKANNAAQIDLMSATPVSFGNFTLASGTYSEVELKIQLNKNGSSPALELTGQFTNSATMIPVVFRVNEFAEIKTEQHNVTIAANTSFTASTMLDLSSFTSGITESMITGGTLTGGTLVISSSSNQNLYNIILNNFKSEQHHVEFEHD